MHTWANNIGYTNTHETTIKKMGFNFFNLILLWEKCIYKQIDVNNNEFFTKEIMIC